MLSFNLFGLNFKQIWCLCRKSKYLKKYTLYEEVLDTKYMRKLDGDEKLVEIFHNWKIKCDKSVFFRLHLNPERNK